VAPAILDLMSTLVLSGPALEGLEALGLGSKGSWSASGPGGAPAAPE
jgi:hypothetical protein